MRAIIALLLYTVCTVAVFGVDTFVRYALPAAAGAVCAYLVAGSVVALGAYLFSGGEGREKIPYEPPYHIEV